ncbi:hypothetical protein V5O48_015549 [Marasmius crinis-equi]|uniref:Uncharacterized protein n=1 Tax=Marasmius crinis-equi TaxID=585013 RepID=A0ABR3EU85_9AGAR
MNAPTQFLLADARPQQPDTRSTFPAAPGHSLDTRKYENNHLSAVTSASYHQHCDANCRVYTPPEVKLTKPRVIKEVPFYTAVRGFLFWGQKAVTNSSDIVLKEWWNLVKDAVLPGPWKVFIDAIDRNTPLPSRSPFVDGSLGVDRTPDWYDQRWRKQYPDLWCPGHPRNVHLFDHAAALAVVPRVAEIHLHRNPPTKSAPHEPPSRIPKAPEPDIGSSTVPSTSAGKRRRISVSDDETNYGNSATGVCGSTPPQSGAPPRMKRKRAAIIRAASELTLEKDDKNDFEAAPEISNGPSTSQAMTDDEYRSQAHPTALIIANDSLLPSDDEEDDEVYGLLAEY